jgi:hypothetical protein
MGNANPSSAIPGGIIIELNKPSYKPGEVVNGSIYVNMIQSFSTKNLEMTLHVQQYTKFREISSDEFHEKNRMRLYMKHITGDHKNIKIKEHKEGKKEYFNGSIVIASYSNNLIPPGQYQYPFSFVLPLNLPGSFEFYDGSNIAYSAYFLEASLAAVNRSQIIKTQNLIIVNQAQETMGIVNQMEKTARLKTWCCIKRGSSTLMVNILKDSFYTNDTIMADCMLDNTNTKLDADNIKVQLMQKIVLKDNSGRNRLIQRKITDLSYKNIYKAGKKSRQTFELPIIDNENPALQHIHQCNHQHLFRSTDLISKLQASIKSELIDCTYHLLVKPEYDTVMMSSERLVVEIPIAIYIPDIRIDISLFRPKSWNPHICPGLKFDFHHEDIHIQNNPMIESKIEGVVEEEQPQILQLNN